MQRAAAMLIWAAVALALVVPLSAALHSPLLAWRSPVYIVAGAAGVLAMTLLVMQPLLGVAALPGLRAGRARRWHRCIGVMVVVLVVVHVGGLWITSPPDVIDALLFASPTPFSPWGVVAMWAVFVSAVLAAVRRRLRLRHWRGMHVGLGVVIMLGSVVHALLIEGTMEPLSKALLCLFGLAGMAVALRALAIAPRQPRHALR